MTKSEIIEMVKKVLIEKYGSLDDCCTEANYLFRYAWIKTGYTACECARWRGDIIVTDSEGDSYEQDHEWLVVDGDFIDITEEQFSDIDYSSGVQQEWVKQHFDKNFIEMKNKIKAIIET